MWPHKTKQKDSLCRRVGPLMVGCRLIERMIAVLQAALTQIEMTRTIDPLSAANAVDFVRACADRTCYHGEDKIFFLASLNLFFRRRRPGNACRGPGIRRKDDTRKVRLGRQIPGRTLRIAGKMIGDADLDGQNNLRNEKWLKPDE